MKINKPDSVTKSEWKRLSELAARNIYMDTAPYPDLKGRGDFDFLQLLNKCERGGLVFEGMEQYEDNCPICIESKKMIVLEALDPALAVERKLWDVKMNYDDMGPLGKALRRLVKRNGPMMYFPDRPDM